MTPVAPAREIPAAVLASIRDAARREVELHAPEPAPSQLLKVGAIFAWGLHRIGEDPRPEEAGEAA